MNDTINKGKSRFLSIEELAELDNKMKNQEIETPYIILDAVVDPKGFRRCPHCNESYYRENYSISTAMYCPPIYKDGVNINLDRNKTTTYCTCMSCGKEFSY